jgi:hypothetical protein
MRPRFRYSLRLLLILTALAAAGCYWWIARPTMLANRFVRAVQSEQFALANQQFANPDDAMLARQRAGHKYPTEYPTESAYAVPFQDEPYDVEWHAKVHPRTWGDMFAGRRRISLSGSYWTAYNRTRHVEAYEIDSTPTQLTVVGRIAKGYGR